MNNFGDFLYSLRKEKGMTQAELAKLLDVTNKAVSKWETGEAMPETALLLPLSRILAVSVDELLEGKRSNKQTKNEENDIDENEIIKSHLFTRGKDDIDEKTLSEKIVGIICAVVMFSGILTYFLLGILSGRWHPYWVIVAVSTLLCGVIGCLFDVINAKRRKKKLEHGENPFTGAICGVFMLCCIIVFLLLGAFLNLWHPLWIILVIGSFVCAMVAMIIEIIFHKNK